MRLKTAAAILLLGLIALVAGIGQLSWWAPDEHVTAVLPADAQDAPLTVIDTGLRDLRGGDATLTVRSEGSFTLSAARPDDIEAWVGPAAHNTIDGASEDGRTLTVAHTDGEATSPDPAGADLFAASQSASGTLEYRWELPDDGEWQLLLASDGSAPAPRDVTITWPSNATTPWGVPLIVVGALAILAAVALVLLGARRGPGSGIGRGSAARRPQAGWPAAPTRRGRPGSAPRMAGPSSAPRDRGAQGRGLRAAAAGTAIVAGLAGLGAAVPAANAATSPAPAASEKVLIDEQLTRILEQTGNAVQAGDDAKDAAKLAPRVDGTALLTRTQNYKVRAAVASAPALSPVRASDLLTSVVTTRREWPRTVVAVTQGEGNTTPQLLTLRQASARENYKLIEAAPLLPGATFPSTSRAGVEQLPLDDKAGLVNTPGEAIAGLADRLTSPDSSWKDRIPENAYIADTQGYQADIVASSPNGDFAFSHSLVGDEAVAFRTADGGAIVLAPLDFTVEGTPKAEGDKVTLADDAAALAGGKEATSKMVLTFRETVMLYVPKEGASQNVTLIGATRNLSGASVG
ncbi:hypothetical protein [Sinomonas mesophila]|uniref:hypothetical protein n=1 Tax=Sinomonas mesophila TaxID=1531955 RepID=UPI001FE8D34F|nr:hypothetical protein [Sinomonas mesophila]